MIKNRTFLIRGSPEVPPGAPEASWTAYTAADCTPTPGTLGYNCTDPAPAPGPGETTFTYCFQPLFLYLLASNTWFLVDPHAPTLVPRGRRSSFWAGAGAGGWVLLGWAGVGSDPYCGLLSWRTGNIGFAFAQGGWRHVLNCFGRPGCYF